MIEFFKNLAERRQQRREAYYAIHGKPDTFAESYHKDRAMRKEYINSLPRSTQTTEDRDNILRHAAVWERWTGSRFEREENPIIKMDKREYMRSCWSRLGENSKPKIEDYTARSCPVTGDYKKV